MTVPTSTDTADLRSGPETNQALLALLPLVGAWHGQGTVRVPASGEELAYAQRVSFSHDGRPFLIYSSQTWLVNPDGSVLRPASRECGFWRAGPGQDDVELVLSLATGIIEVFTGIAGEHRWELATGVVGFTPTAKKLAGERRLYAMVDDTLTYVQELALEPGDFRPHLTAQLSRTH